MSICRQAFLPRRRHHELFFPEYNQSIGLAVYPDTKNIDDTNGYWCMHLLYLDEVE